jgi:hypothetical protein
MPLEHTNRVIALLEQHRSYLPFADEDLARHRQLREALTEQNQRSEQALHGWRAALSQRWSCEIAGQRTYNAIQRQLDEFYGEHAPYLQLLAATQLGVASTANELLVSLRRCEASLRLLSPAPPFAAEALQSLVRVIDELANTVDETSHWEATRRNVLIEQRMAAQLCFQAQSKTRRRLAAIVGEDLASDWFANQSAD